MKICLSYFYHDSTDTLLGQGLASKNFIVTVVAIVTDTLGDFTKSEKRIPVLPLSNAMFFPVAIKAITNFVKWKNELSNSLAVYATITATTNNIDCGSASKCASMNRYECSFITNTCGECTSDYYGASGSTNMPCLPSSNVPFPISSRDKHIFLSSSASSGAVGSPCINNLDCLSGVCQTAYSGSFCAHLGKTCPGYPSECSRHGECVYLADGMQNRTSCDLADSSCRAECSCKSGYYGTACSFKTAAVNLERKRREVLCVQLRASILSQDIDRNMVIRKLILNRLLFCINFIPFIDISTILGGFDAFVGYVFSLR